MDGWRLKHYPIQTCLVGENKCLNLFLDSNEMTPEDIQVSLKSICYNYKLICMYIHIHKFAVVPNYIYGTQIYQYLRLFILYCLLCI